MKLWKIVNAVAGRMRESGAWSVCLTLEKPGFMCTQRTEQHYVKLDAERFWEDQRGWYLDPESPDAMACDEAVAKFTPWKIESASAQGEK